MLGTLKSFLPTAAMVKAGLIGAAGVAVVRAIEDKTNIGLNITTGGKVGDAKLLPEIGPRNGVPITLALVPIAAAVFINKYM